MTFDVFFVSIWSNTLNLNVSESFATLENFFNFSGKKFYFSSVVEETMKLKKETISTWPNACDCLFVFTRWREKA